MDIDLIRYIYPTSGARIYGHRDTNQRYTSCSLSHPEKAHRGRKESLSGRPFVTIKRFWPWYLSCSHLVTKLLGCGHIIVKTTLLENRTNLLQIAPWCGIHTKSRGLCKTGYGRSISSIKRQIRAAINKKLYALPVAGLRGPDRRRLRIKTSDIDIQTRTQQRLDTFIITLIKPPEYYRKLIRPQLINIYLLPVHSTHLLRRACKDTRGQTGHHQRKYPSHFTRTCYISFFSRSRPAPS